MEAALIIKLDEKKLKIVDGIDLSELCITSAVEVQKNSTEDIYVKTNKAEGNKCPICWKISKETCKRHNN